MTEVVTVLEAEVLDRGTGLVGFWVEPPPSL